MSDLFLSYSSRDRDTARRVADALRGEGFDVWWDDALRSGETFDEVIEAALKAAKAVIVLWSQASVASRWVRAEATIADRLGTLIPAMIEPCERPIVFELLHTADLTHWRGSIADRGWQGFVADIRKQLAGERAEDSPTPVQIARGAAYKLPDKPSIAVLPFAEPATAEPLADGIVEEISTALSHFQTLFVIAGASSLTYRDPDRDPLKVCRELGVRYLLDGSVRQAGRRVRITVKLIDGIEGQQVWADKFEDSLDDIFDLQDRIASAVAARIDSSIDTAEVQRAVTRPTGSPDANELYWRANAVFRKFDPQAFAEAIRLSEAALALDPRHGWAASLAAFCHGCAFAYGWAPDRAQARAAALAHYENAMRIGGGDARVLGYCAATLASVGGDIAVASRLADQALALNPGSATTLFWAGWSDAIVGRPERGLERLEQSIRLNPRSIVRPLALTVMGVCLFELERFDEAIEVLNEVRQHLPLYPPALATLAASLAHRARLAEAGEVWARLDTLGGEVGALSALCDPAHRDLLDRGLGIARAAAVPAPAPAPEPAHA